MIKNNTRGDKADQCCPTLDSHGDTTLFTFLPPSRRVKVFFFGVVYMYYPGEKTNRDNRALWGTSASSLEHVHVHV